MKSRKINRKFNHIGQKFGKWTILSVDDDLSKIDKYKSRYYFCRCECGTIKSIPLRVIVKVKVNGCDKCGGRFAHLKGEKNPIWKGFGELPGSYFGIIKRNAKIANREFSLDKEYLWDLFLSQDGKCILTGLPLSFDKKTKTASLDRIDSSQGYTYDNVQWVHKHINKIKQDLDEDYFIYLCKLVAEREIEREAILDLL